MRMRCIVVAVVLASVSTTCAFDVYYSAIGKNLYGGGVWYDLSTHIPPNTVLQRRAGTSYHSPVIRATSGNTTSEMRIGEPFSDDALGMVQFNVETSAEGDLFRAHDGTFSECLFTHNGVLTRENLTDEMSTFRYTTNEVFTISGNPYSVVINNTRDDIVANGVTIPKGESASMVMPIFLKGFPTADDYASKYYFKGVDGTSISHHYETTRTSPNRPVGTYVYWSGDYEIREYGYDPNNIITNSDELLVYGDIKTSSENRLLFGENGDPVYAGKHISISNITLFTWWDFTQGDWGNDPRAYINNTCVCEKHSTSHIITYQIDLTGQQRDPDTGEWYAYFTMSQVPEDFYYGGDITMRCWSSNYSWETSPASKKSEHLLQRSRATRMAVRFKVIFNKWRDDWRVEYDGEVNWREP